MNNKRNLRHYTVIAWTVLMLAWIIIGKFELVSAQLLPAPWNVLIALKEILFEGYGSHTLLYHLMMSAYRILFSSFLAIITAIPLGLLSGYSARVRAIVDSFIQFYRPLPPLAYYTLLILWFGIGELSKVTLLYLAAFAPIYLACVSSVNHIDQNLILSAKTLGANSRDLFFTIILPASAPEIFVGVRTAIGVAYTTLVSAEMVAATSGIGWMVIDASRYLNVDVMFVGIIIMGLTGVLLDTLLIAIEKRVLFWKYPEKELEKRRSIRWVSIGAVSLALLGGAIHLFNTPTSQAEQVVKIGIIRVPNDKQVAISTGIMEEKFTKHQLKPEFIFFDSGVSANKALVSGSIDFAEMGYTNSVIALSQNVPAEMIWLHDVIGDNEALVAQKDSTIEEIEDLRGKKVATPFGSTSHYSLLNALNLAGIADDVELMDMETQDIVAAWVRGDIDAAYSWEPTLSTIEETGRVLLTSKDLAAEGYGTYNIDLVHETFAKNHPDIVQLYLESLDEAVKAYRENPTEIAKLVAKDLELAPELVEKQMQMTIWLDAEEQNQAEYLGTEKNPGNYNQQFIETAEFLYKNKMIPYIPDTSAVKSFIKPVYSEQVGGRP